MPDEPPWKPTLARAFRKDDGTALTLGDLEALFRERPVRCIKTMQCLMDSPAGGLCSNGLWEGVALRDVLARLGRLKDVRRVFYTGFFEDPKHRFASSLSLSEVLETPPGHTPVFLALRLNGRPLPIERGGPVRMLVPEGYGFKSIKWLNRVVLTNDYRANDTYAERQNNDPSSPMKTLARPDIHAPQSYRHGEPVTLRGVAVVGASGLKRVEYWLRKDRGTHGVLDPDDPAWATAEWKEATLPGGPPEGWATALPGGRFPEGVAHLDPATGRPLVVAAAVQLGGVGGEAGGAGGVELRVPGAGGGPQRVRPAGAPPEPAVGHRRGAVHDVHRRLKRPRPLTATCVDVRRFRRSTRVKLIPRRARKAGEVVRTSGSPSKRPGPSSSPAKPPRGRSTSTTSSRSAKWGRVTWSIRSICGPVRPNRHAVIHLRSDPPYLIEDVRIATERTLECPYKMIENERGPIVQELASSSPSSLVNGC